VSARLLLAVFDSVYLVALTAWIGSILFLSFGVAPIVFPVLGAESGGKFVRALFPRYYLWGATCGSLALPAFVAGPLCFQEDRSPLVGVQALAILACTLIMLYAGNSLVPQINRARDEGPSAHERFQRLHRRSVRLNALVLVVGLGLLLAFANRPGPRTSGIRERTDEATVQEIESYSRTVQEIESYSRGVRP
jgi:putative copper export protein